MKEQKEKEALAKLKLKQELTKKQNEKKAQLEQKRADKRAKWKENRLKRKDKKGV